MGSFKDQLSDDLDGVFFKTGEADGVDQSEFADVFLYRPGGIQANQYEISGILDATTEVAQPQGTGDQTGNYAKVLSKYIRVMFKEAAIINGTQPKDTLVYKTVEYKVVQFDSDGVGVITLILHRK